MGRIPVIYQTTDSDCGLCCISMIASRYAFRQPLVYYRNKFNVGRDGISIAGIVDIYKKININAKVVQVDDLQNYMLYNYKAPCILFLKSNHFVVIEKRYGRVNIYDPASGKKSYTLSNFRDVSYAKLFGKYIIEPLPASNFHPQKGDISALRHIKPYIMKFKNVLFRVLLLSVIAYMVSLSIPLLLQHLIDSLVSFTSPGITKFAAIAALLLCAFTVFSFLKNHIITNCQAKIYKALYSETTEQLFAIPYAYYDNRTQGNILFRLNILTQFESIISTLFPQFILLGTSTVVVFFYLSLRYIYLIPVIVITSLLVIIYIIMANNTLILMRDKQVHESERLNNVNTEVIQDMLQIRSMHLSSVFLTKVHSLFENFNNITRKTNSWSLNLNQIANYFTLFMPFFGVLYLIAVANQNSPSVGELVAIYSLLGTFFSSAISFFTLFLNASAYKSTLEYLNDLLDEKPMNKGRDCLPGKFKTLSFSNVSFSYNSAANNIISDVSFTVSTGEKLAIVGKSGSGKTTLLKLLVGLYNPSKGSIEINGYDLGDISDSYFATGIAIVPQNSFIVNDSIANNVTLGDESISDQEIMEALQIVNLDKDVLSMPLGLRTVVSSTSSNLSGGQIQRLAIARALVRKPDLLILDEATSSLDSINEECIYEHLSKLGLTMIVISHRLSTIQDADNIIVLQDGRIVECGSHEKLIHQRGIYYDLFNHQKQMN